MQELDVGGQCAEWDAACLCVGPYKLEVRWSPAALLLCVHFSAFAVLGIWIYLETPSAVLFETPLAR